MARRCSRAALHDHCCSVAERAADITPEDRRAKMAKWIRQAMEKMSERRGSIETIGWRSLIGRGVSVADCEP